MRLERSSPSPAGPWSGCAATTFSQSNKVPTGRLSQARMVLPYSRELAEVRRICFLIGRFWHNMNQLIQRKEHDSINVHPTIQTAQLQEDADTKESERRRVEEVKQREEARFEVQYVKWVCNHSETISEVMEVTERKVSVVDEYGDENWDAVQKEIASDTQ